MNRLQNLQANKPALQKQASVRGTDEFGRKGPQFLTMTRADFAAYEYLCRQAEAKEWIETILGKQLPDADLWKSLGNGVILCELANAIWPKEHPVNRIHPAGSFSFKLIENIDMFLNAISTHGMPKTDLFTPTDLFEKKNMPFVLNTLYKLSHQIEKEGFTVHWNKQQNLDFSPKEIQEAKKLEGVNLWEKKGASKNVSDVIIPLRLNPSGREKSSRGS
jgi:Ras GTPase-activating-like protein IQGAP2/3